MVVVGTYNMSFAGDKFPEKMPTFASEYSFHLMDNDRPRMFWNNAKAHLFNFIDKKNPLAVGLQEMNVKEIEQDFKADDKGGINGIKTGLPDNYKIVSDKVIANDAAVSIIYNENITGKFFKKKTLDNPHQGGRPLFMVLTKKEDKTYYLFVNMHGAQDAANGLFEKEFNDMMQKNKVFLETEVEKFLDMNPKEKINPDHIYIMGDFNDRYDYIEKFTIKGKDVLYIGDSPKACCHNWDSMGKETERVTIQKKKLEGPTLEAAAANASEKVQGKKSITINDEEKKGGIIIPTEHGINIADYINKGDKVFSSDTHAGKLHIYTGGEADYMNKPSNKSDHELVYMEIKEVTEGEGAEAPAPAPATETSTQGTEGGWGLPKLFGGKRKSRKGRKSKKNKKSNRKTKKMARKTKKKGKK